MTEKKYLVDDSFRPYGYISDIEGKKGGTANETLPPTSIENYRATMKQHQEKMQLRAKENGVDLPDPPAEDSGD